MQSHEYRVVPAPRRGVRARGARRAEERFAKAVEAQMNLMAAEGWDYVRSDTLPCDRKSGWFSRPVTVFETVLVFRRPTAEAQAGAPGDWALAVPEPAPARAAPDAVPDIVRPPQAATAVAPVAQVAPPPVAPPTVVPPAARFAPAPSVHRPEAPVAMPPVAPALHLVEPAEPRPQDGAGRSQAAL